MARKMHIPFKPLKTVFVTMLLFFSIFVVFNPTAFAFPFPFENIIHNFYTCQAVLDIDYDEEAAMDPLLPINRTKTIKLSFTPSVNGYFADQLVKQYGNAIFEVLLNVDDKPDWCAISLNPLKMGVSGGAIGEAAIATLIISVNENAPAFEEDTIKLRVWMGGAGAIEGGEYTRDIRFRAGYLPLVGLNAPNNFLETSPGETAKFNIELENLGNAKTKFESKVLNIPEGWEVEIPSNTVVDPKRLNTNYKETISLVVRPSIDFGYHDEREIIQVSITPVYFKDSSLKGDEYLLSFVVQNRGFSTPGFELFVALIAIASLIIITRKRLSGGKSR